VATRDWNDDYEHGVMPWNLEEPEPHLVEFVRTHRLAPCRVLDIGCGTGTHALWLAEHGFDVLGIDVSPRAIELAQAREVQGTGRCRFAVVDFLAGGLDEPPFDLVFDRGCFHVFDAADDRSRFAGRVASCLHADGQWLSLIGSTEGPPRDHGPPRRSARDIADAIEPVLEIVQLQAIEFDLHVSTPPRAWLCVSRPRAVPAQPSTVHALAE
jgi:SAM-dependent methyltransferase